MSIRGSSRIAVVPLALLLAVASGAAFFKLRPAGNLMTANAQGFLATLSPEQKAIAQLPFGDKARLDWHFIPKPARKGMQFKDMGAKQRKAAHALLESGLSELGYEKADTIMRLDAILRELEKNRKDAPIRDAERYYLTIFGEPSPTGEWGFSVEGHHLSLNFVIREGAIASLTPFMLGANPADVRSDAGVGPAQGTRVLANEEGLAFELLGALSDEQKAKAILADKAPAEIRAAGAPLPPDTAPEGLAAAAMNEAQVEKLWALIRSYTGNMPIDEGEKRVMEIKDAGIGQVHFAWSGAREPGIGHYYRVQGPTFLIEFVNTQPDGAGNPANHIHSVWRELSRDFGGVRP